MLDSITNEDLWHMADRAGLHYLMTVAVQVFGMHFQWWLERRFKWMPRVEGWWAYLVPALVAQTLIQLREPLDVAHGQLAVKAFTDYLSWMLGFGSSTYALYRLGPRLNYINLTIKRRRLR